MRFIDREEIERQLTYTRAIPIVRAAMIAFSRGLTKQTLRTIIPLSEGRLFGLMPGAMGAQAVFGAKLISVFKGNFDKGVPSHQGVIVLFEPESGAPVCVLEAGAVTAIRTAAASAAATDTLARADATRLALLGYGEQARTHARAIAEVRALTHIAVWGRARARAEAFAAEMTRELSLPVEAMESAEAAVADADIVCTLTAASGPVLNGAWLKPGAHVNIVGSSYAGPVEIDHDAVMRARFIVDSREGVIAQGAEFLRAKAAGLIDDDHIAGEIGQVFAGDIAGRQDTTQITAYKSLGHIVQDLACAWALYEEAV